MTALQAATSGIGTEPAAPTLEYRTGDELPTLDKVTGGWDDGPRPTRADPMRIDETEP
jgi:hypothetical protein